MRKILTTIGEAFAFLFAIIIALGFSPLIIGAIVVFGAPHLYALIWAKIRHDPREDLKIQELQNDTWESENTKDGFVEAFTRLSDSLAKLSKSKSGEIIYGGFEIFYEGSRDIDWADLSLARTLKSKHAEVELSLEFGVSIAEDGHARHVGMDDDDDRHEPFPPLTARVVTPRLHKKRSFTLLSSKDAWIVIGFLRGDVKFAQPSGQLWAYIPEHKVWLVEYKADGSEYGQRGEFTNVLARRFGKDVVVEVPGGSD